MNRSLKGLETRILSVTTTGLSNRTDSVFAVALQTCLQRFDMNN